MKKHRTIIRLFIASFILLLFSTTWAYEAKQSAARKPASISSEWKGLIGKYKSGSANFLVLEKGGKLFLLFKNKYFPVEEAGNNHFTLNKGKLFGSGYLQFTRNKHNFAVKCKIGNKIFIRKFYGPETGKTFRIKPIKPVDEIRPVAMKAKPALESGRFRKPELVEVIKLDPTIKLDIRYATSNNFMGAPFYSSPHAFLQKPAAEALVRVHRKLKKIGYGILIFDAYRPWHVTKMFYMATPSNQKHFVANPKNGSRHNRGCAVDVTLYDLKTGKPVEMTGGFDEFSQRSYSNHPGGTSLQRCHRDLLKKVMKSEGFSVYKYEWWHFDYKDWKKYPIMNMKFEGG